MSDESGSSGSGSGGPPPKVEIVKNEDGPLDLSELFKAAGEYVVKPLAESSAHAEIEKAKAAAEVQKAALERDTARIAYLKSHLAGRLAVWGLLVACTTGVIVFAIHREQASLATELIKTIASLGAVAFGGYGLAKSRRE